MLRYPSGQVDCPCPSYLQQHQHFKRLVTMSSRDIEKSALLQERRIRYPVADEEDSWPGDPTRSYAGNQVPASA